MTEARLVTRSPQGEGWESICVVEGCQRRHQWFVDPGLYLCQQHLDELNRRQSAAAVPAEGLLEAAKRVVHLAELGWTHPGPDWTYAVDQLRAALARHESADDDEFELESVHHGGNGPEGSR